jgi:O-antigen/teichoic acid export membrane protein
MLSKMKDMVSVGLYSSAGKLMEIGLMLPLAFYVLNLPVAARFYKHFRESVQQKIEGYTEALFMVVFFVFGLTTFFAEHILVFFYGSSFIGAAWALRVLMLAFLIQSAEIVLAMSSQAAGYHKIAMYIVALRAVLNVLLNLILIPIAGMLGAALATLLSVVFSFVLFQIFVMRTLHGFQWIAVIKKPAATCLLIMIVLFALNGHLSTVYLMVMFLLGYGLSALALNGFSFFRSPPTGLS